MADNQLNHDELVRLESLTSALNHASYMEDTPDANSVVETASVFEDFLKGSN